MRKNRWKKILTNPTFWILFTSFVLAFLIIFVSQYLFESFEQLTLRLLVGFSLFFGTILVMLAYKLYFKEETQKRLKAKRKLQEKDKESVLLLEKKIKDLKSRFIEATKIIKSSSIYKNKRDTNYELPWYLMVGREKEGKTSLLESSGLEFPLNINYSKRVVSEEGSTESFQWYFAEHAIFVDMPGKYIEQTPDSTEEGVWKAFLKLFRRQRWKRPINGIILTISVDTLVKSSEKELEEYAKMLRDRFDELSNTFMSTIPIYMFITKADQVTGFTEYFASIDEDEKQEILGVTFDDQENIDSSIVQPEFEALIQRLDASILDRIHQDWDNSSRTKTLLFCDELSNLFEKINILIDIGFAQTRYRTPLMIRGIYFTSVEQEYTPATHQQDVQQMQNNLASAASKKGLFSLKVLKNVIFPEADIIKMDTSYRQQQKNRHILGVGISLAIVAFIAVVWIIDFNKHNEAIKQYEKMLTKYNFEKKSLGSVEDFEKSLYLLNHLYQMKDFQNPNEAGRFWRLAFYEVDNRQEKIDELYFKSLEKIFLPYVKALIESQIKSNLTDYDLTWASTKAYLMLKEKEHRNSAFMKEWMASVWSQLYPNKLTIQNNLNGHWERLINSDFVSYELDENILKSARIKLLGLGRDVLVYKQLQEKSEDMGLNSFQFSQVLGSNTGSFEGNSYVIPGFYTKRGYEKVIVKNRKKLIKELVRSNWVVGYDTNLTDTQLNDLSAKVQSLYFLDYKKHWMKAVNTLQVPYKDTIAQISDQLTILTSSNSPIVSVLAALKENTLLYTPEELKMKQLQEGLGKTTQVAAKATKKTTLNIDNQAKKLMDNSSVKNVREFFKDFHLLIDKESEPTNLLKSAMEKLNKAYLETTAMNGSVSPRRDAFKIVSDRIKGQHAPIVTKSPLLPIPVDRWIQKALQNDWEYIIAQSKLYINDQYNTEVYFYYKDKIAGKYPFYTKARTEVTIMDFEEFFKKDGMLDQFYTAYITPFVNIDHRNKKFAFRNIDGSAMDFSKSFIYSLMHANDIQKRFFDTKGEILKTTMYITPHDLGRNLAGMSLYYNNNHINYEHGPIKSRKISWPASNENPNVSFKLYDLNSQEVVNYKAEGEWALFRVLSQLRSKNYSITRNKESVIVGHFEKKYTGSFELSGDPVKVFSKSNPLKNFYLRGDI